MNNKKEKIRKRNHKILIPIVIIVILLTIGGGYLLKIRFSDNHNLDDDYQIEIENDTDILFDLRNDLVITQIGKYSGVYMEDGSDEIVSDVLMIIVKNIGEKPLQYTEIYLNAEESKAEFSLTTLPVGKSAVVLEKNRMSFDDDVNFSDAEAVNTVWFQEKISLQEDLFQIQTIDGVMNIKNISKEDVLEDIVIYYKNYSSNLFYGGITYRVRLTGGMKSGEIKQINPEHFSSENSKVMFITRG